MGVLLLLEAALSVFSGDQIIEIDFPPPFGSSVLTSALAH